MVLNENQPKIRNNGGLKLRGFRQKDPSDIERNSFELIKPEV